MNEQLIGQIEELGLSNKEARVYVACLTLGASPVQKIADQAGIKRVTAYVILESLVSLGLVSQSVKGKKTFFNAEEPSNLRRLLEKREQEVKEQKLNFEQVLPELLNLKKLPKDTPAVKFFEGAEGIRSIMSSFFETHREGVQQIFGVSNLNQVHAFFPDIREQQANPERLKAKVSSRIIYTHEDGPILAPNDKNRNRESLWVPEDKFPLSGDLNVVGDHIVMLSLTRDNPIGITIESRELSKGLSAWFELAWEAAKDYNK
jgi:sugar-specific transcriptional regulator TrmB